MTDLLFIPAAWHFIEWVRGGLQTRTNTSHLISLIFNSASLKEMISGLGTCPEFGFIYLENITSVWKLARQCKNSLNSLKFDFPHFLHWKCGSEFSSKRFSHFGVQLRISVFSNVFWIISQRVTANWGLNALNCMLTNRNGGNVMLYSSFTAFLWPVRRKCKHSCLMMVKITSNTLIWKSKWWSFSSIDCSSSSDGKLPELSPPFFPLFCVFCKWLFQ